WGLCVGRGTWNKSGLEAGVGKRYEYKSAPDRLTEQGFTGPAREALERLAASLTGQLADAIAQRLGVPAADARGLIDDGPYVAAAAAEHRLVGALGYPAEGDAHVPQPAPPAPHPLYL